MPNNGRPWDNADGSTSWVTEQTWSFNSFIFTVPFATQKNAFVFQKMFFNILIKVACNSHIGFLLWISLYQITTQSFYGQYFSVFSCLVLSSLRPFSLRMIFSLCFFPLDNDRMTVTRCFFCQILHLFHWVLCQFYSQAIYHRLIQKCLKLPVIPSSNIAHGPNTFV